MKALLVLWITLALVAEACAIVRRNIAGAWGRRPWGRNGTRGPY